MELPERGRQSRPAPARPAEGRGGGLPWLADPGIALGVRPVWLTGWRSKARLLVFVASALLIVLHLQALDRAVRLVLWVFFAPLAY